MNSIVSQLIQKAVEGNSYFLDLGNLGLTEIPVEVENLPASITHINFGAYHAFGSSNNSQSLNTFRENNWSVKRLANNKKLQKIELHGCEIDKEGIDYLSAFTHLISLNIRLNDLNSDDIESLSRLINLTDLNISDNPIGDEGAESLSRLINLNKLNISSNVIGDEGAESLSRLMNLTDLDISYNEIGDDGAKSLSRLINLTDLDISDNEIGAQGAESLSHLLNLTNLDISYNKIGAQGADSLSRLINLTDLDISDNEIGAQGAESLSRLINLNKLNISSNVIGDEGAESLSRLINLTDLEISDNEIGAEGAKSLSLLINLNNLHIFRNEVGAQGVESLSRLINLTALEISENEIGDEGAESLSRLINLNKLFINSNEIGDGGAESLSRLINLTDLEISANEIGDQGATSICNLNNLVHLGIHYNHLTRVIPLLKLTNLYYLGIIGNSAKDVPKSIIQDYFSCLPKLKIWADEIKDNSLTGPNEVVKLQVLGNGNAGKSSIIEALKNNSCKIKFQSTHGVVIDNLIFNHENSVVNFHVWDFGGQEIYHGTHKLFISSQSIHLIVVDDESEQLAKDQIRVPDRENSNELVLHHPLQYYIDLSKRQSPSSIRIIIRNKSDISPFNTILKSIAEKNELIYLEVSATEGLGIDQLRKLLSEKRTDLLDYGMLMPHSWLKVRKYFIDNLTGDPIDRRKMISKKKYEDICNLCNVSDLSRPILLDFLHSTGVVYKNESLFEEIITDQQWALDVIYKVLDRKSIFYQELRNDYKGRVRIAEIFTAFGQEYTEGHKKLFLNLMQSCGLCFPLFYGEDRVFDERYYIFPEFLPEEETPAVKKQWVSASDVKIYTHKAAYIDYSRIQSFIVELGNKTDTEYIWKNGILIFTSKGLIKVELKRDQSTIRVSMESSAVDDYLWLILNDFELDGEEALVWTSQDGQVIDLSKLEHRFSSGRYYKIADHLPNNRSINQFEEGNTTPTIENVLPNIEQKEPKRLVISYASENINELDALVEALANYEMDGLLQVQYDKRQVDGRNNWDEQIKKMFHDAHGYLLLISLKYQNFIKHKYIWDNEVPMIIKRNTMEGIFTYCLCVGPVNINSKISGFASFRGGKVHLPESGNARDQFLVDFVQEVIEGKFLNDN